MRHAIGFWIVLAVGVSAWVQAADSIEELPPPRQETSTPSVQSPASESPDNLWGLVGPRGRHYFTGSGGLFDYVQEGQRRVVRIDAEDGSAHAGPDDNFLYFREAVSGHRWAVARHANSDRRYRIYFQAADATGGWQLFQRAQATWEQPSVEEPPLWILPEASCGLPGPQEMEVQEMQVFEMEVLMP